MTEAAQGFDDPAADPQGEPDAKPEETSKPSKPRRTVAGILDKIKERQADVDEKIRGVVAEIRRLEDKITALNATKEQLDVLASECGADD